MRLLQQTIRSDESVRGAKGVTTPSRLHGVLLINLGTPDQLDVPSVRRYLAEFLSDPEVIRLPSSLRWLNGILGRTIARFRAPCSTRMYQKIWTARGSPLKVITEDQVWALESVLPSGWRVFHAMRYGRPAIGDTLGEIEAAGVEKLVVIPMYPQFSGPTTGTAFRVLYEYLERRGHQIHVTTRNTWYDDSGYAYAQAARIKQYAESMGLMPRDTYLLFSAHGLPVSYVDRGDPYPTHVGRSIELVTQRLGWPTKRFCLAYQSRMGPVEWLRPNTAEVLMELVHKGERRVLVCPISFTADCLETLEEINLRYRAQFEEAGGQLYLCPALNTFGPFILALKDLVLRGPKPVTSWSGGVGPLMSLESGTPAGDEHIGSLVMIGVCLRGHVGPGPGPQLRYIAADVLRKVKKPQCELPALLRSISHKADVREAWLWNTCRRFEFYGWIETGGDAGKRSRILTQVRRSLFGADEPPDVAVNVLYGADVWHHLLRTAVGLNSGLPGEQEIIEQFQAGHRLARCAGTAGPLAERLLADVLAFERSLRAETEWHRFHPNYCFAALSRIFKSIELDVSQSRAVVIGGSTTSASLLRTLIERFEMPSPRLTLLHRGHRRGGQIKLLRKAIGHGRRIRVQSYSEPSVARAIADADMVFFCIDREEPVLDPERIHNCRDLVARPLTIMDFNIFGSTRGMETLAGVRLYNAEQLEAEVGAFANEMCSTDEFASAVNAAETYICEHAKAAADPPRRKGVVVAAPPQILGLPPMRDEDDVDASTERSDYRTETHAAGAGSPQR